MLIAFDEGKDWLLQHGWPDPTWFLLSRRGVSDGDRFSASDSLPGVREITGDGYTRLPASRPLSDAGLMRFAQLRWQTGDSFTWPADARSVCAATSKNGSGILLCAWDLQESGAPRDFSQPQTFWEGAPVFRL